MTRAIQLKIHFDEKKVRSSMKIKCILFLQTKLLLNFFTLRSSTKQQKNASIPFHVTRFFPWNMANVSIQKKQIHQMFHFFFSPTLYLSISGTRYIQNYTQSQQKRPFLKKGESIACSVVSSSSSSSFFIGLFVYIKLLMAMWLYAYVNVRFFCRFLKAFAWQRNKCTNSFRCFIM